MKDEGKDSEFDFWIGPSESKMPNFSNNHLLIQHQRDHSKTVEVQQGGTAPEKRLDARSLSDFHPGPGS